MNMFELTHRKSWELSYEQLIEKHKQVRKLMFLMLIPSFLIFGLGYFTWIFSSMVVFPVLMFVISILFFLMLNQLKMLEFTLSVVICNKKN